MFGPDLKRILWTWVIQYTPLNFLIVDNMINSFTVLCANEYFWTCTLPSSCFFSSSFFSVFLCSPHNSVQHKTNRKCFALWYKSTQYIPLLIFWTICSPHFLVGTCAAAQIGDPRTDQWTQRFKCRISRRWLTCAQVIYYARFICMCVRACVRACVRGCMRP